MNAMILPLSLLCLCVRAAAQDRSPSSNDYPLPTETDLGAGWQQPTVFGQLHNEPDAGISDQDYVLFTVGPDGGSRSYAVIVDRYRDENESQEGFAALAKTGFEEFEDTTLQGIGD